MYEPLRTITRSPIMAKAHFPGLQVLPCRNQGIRCRPKDLTGRHRPPAAEFGSSICVVRTSFGKTTWPASFGASRGRFGPYWLRVLFGCCRGSCGSAVRSLIASSETARKRAGGSVTRRKNEVIACMETEVRPCWHRSSDTTAFCTVSDSS